MHWRTLKMASLLTLAVVLTGCGDDEEVYDPVPATPQGVFSVTGNDSVFIYWYGPYERDIASFIVWRSLEPIHNYTQIGSRPADANPNLDLITYEFIDAEVDNGDTYYYAVSSVDHAGQISELSAEMVYDTPRPDGEIRFYDMYVKPDSSALNLDIPRVVGQSDPSADVYIDSDGNGILYLNAAYIDTEIQSMGYTSAFDEIGKAPVAGWSLNGWAEIVPGHTYVIRITDVHGDFNYAKMRAIDVDWDNGAVLFQWAYQRDENNPQLVPRQNGSEPIALHVTQAANDGSKDR